MHPGYIGAIVGITLGVIGGVIGTYFSIKRTNGPRERAFLIKMGLLFWIGAPVFIGLMFLLPHPHRYGLWILYAIVFPSAVILGNRRLQKIRSEESRLPPFAEPK